MSRISAALIALCLLLLPLAASAQQRLILATTTSTENSGLLHYILPAFTKKTGIPVHVVAVGTGKALKLAGRCDADLVMVHAPALEKRFVAKGLGVERKRLMHNYFTIVGPASDPAGVAGASSAAEAMRRIAAKKAPFISRGDNSGTNVKEKALWKAAGVVPNWPGYKEAGQGMGAVLTMAGQLEAYTLSDTGTFIKYKSVGKLSLVSLLERDDLLKNPYSVILVNPAHCPKVNNAGARALVRFLLSAQGQKLIGGYQALGKTLFVPDAAAGAGR